MIYRDESRPTYEEQVPTLQKGALVKQPIESPSDEVWESIKQEFV